MSLISSHLGVLILTFVGFQRGVLECFRTIISILREMWKFIRSGEGEETFCAECVGGENGI